MANQILYTNKIKTVNKTLVADSSNTSYPSTNLQTDNYAQTWRSANVSTSHNIVNDFLTAQTCDTCFLGNVNLTSAATVSIQANATDAWGAPSFSTNFVVSGLGLVPAHRNLYITFASQSFRFWRLLINNTTNPAGFYEVGEWWLGNRVSMTTGQDMEADFKKGYVRNNVKLRTEWGQKYLYGRANYKTFSVDFRNVNSSTRDQLILLENTVAADQYPFVFVVDATTSPIESFFVRMSGDMDIQQTAPASRSFVISTMFEEEAAGLSLPA